MSPASTTLQVNARHTPGPHAPDEADGEAEDEGGDEEAETKDEDWADAMTGPMRCGIFAADGPPAAHAAAARVAADDDPQQHGPPPHGPPLLEYF